MITFPPHLVPTKYDGYFWDIQDAKLYSIKVGGRLRPMTVTYPNKYNNYSSPLYRISVNGVKRCLLISELIQLTTTDYEIPIND